MNKLNDLTGSQWLFRSKSVIKRNYGQGSFAHKIRRLNKACKPPELCKDIIEVFSHKGDLIFDPFAGTGGIVLGAQLAERKIVGYEINKPYIDAYKQACDEIGGLFSIYDKNAIIHKSFFESENQEVDLIFTDPPFFNMDSMTKSKRYHKEKGSLERPMEQFGNIFKDLDEWKDFIFRFCKKSFEMAKINKYMISFMEDMYINGEYIFLTHILADEAKKAGWVPQGEYLWYNEARRPCLFGYPAKMITSRTHTSILFFKKILCK